MPAPDATPDAAAIDHELLARVQGLGPLCDHGRYQSRCVDCGAEPLNASVALPFDVRPVGANVIIEPMAIGPRTVGGLWVPEIAQRDIKRGRVVAVGPGRTRVTEDGTEGWVEEPPAAVGEIIMYGAKWQGEEFDRHGRRFRVLEPEQVLAVIEDETGGHVHRVADAAY